MTSVRLAIYEVDGVTFIANVPRFRNVKWLDEVNSPGTGQFEIHLDDAILASHPDLLADYNVVRIYIDGQIVKGWRIENTNPTRVTSSESSGRWVTVSGRGPAADLESAVVYPEYGLRELTSEDRYFNFSSAPGAWYNPSDWVAPLGVVKTADTTGRKGYPRKWPDPLAKWLWSTDPNAPAQLGINWFRATITVSETTPVAIFVSGDNEYVAYFDGAKIFSSGTAVNGFRSIVGQPIKMTLAAGDHVLAAAVLNVGNGATGTTLNPAGFIASVYRTDEIGNVTADNIFRTDVTNTLVRGYGDQPGWNGASILQQLVIEAQNRGVTNLMPVSFDFDNVTDSAGNAWDDVQDRQTKVGTTDYADLATQLIELTLDMEIDANFVMHCWKKRGTDLTAIVRIQPNRDPTQVAGTTQSGRVRNQALLKFDGGWMELFSAVSKDAYGRREVGLSVGTGNSTQQVELIGTAALRETVQPERTIPLSLTSVKGPQPYVHFSLGDTIVIPDDYYSMIPGRLMSIAGSQLGEGNAIQWDLDFYPETADDAIDTVVVATGGSFSDTSGLYQEEIISDSPWGFWRLQETGGTTFADQSGRKLTMLIGWPGSGTTNKPAMGIAGPVDAAASFNGVTGFTGDDFLMAHARTNITTSTKLFTYKDVTFELWIKRLATPSAKTALLELYDNVGNAPWQLGINTSGHAYFQYTDVSNAFHTLVSSAVLPDTSWTHVVGSKGGAGLKLYVNGVVNQHQTTGLGTPKTVGYNLALRGDEDGDAASVAVAEPAIYGRQLLDSRVNLHFVRSGYTP